MVSAWSTAVRYLVWRERSAVEPIAGMLDELQGVEVLRGEDPDSAVVLMSEATARSIQHTHPGLHVEPDIVHRHAAGSPR